MIHLFINALAASAGGGLTYIRNVAPEFAGRKDVRATILVNSDVRPEFGRACNVEFMDAKTSGTLGRFWYEQRRIPELIRGMGCDVLICAGNFAVSRCPVPQILLSRNSLYLSADFQRDLWRRRHFGMLVDTKVKGSLARRSIRNADLTLAPSVEFAKELQWWTGAPVQALHHGFAWERFLYQAAGLRPEIQSQIDACGNALKILFVSHYNYYRNFETLIRALPEIKHKLQPRGVKLLLTCKLATAGRAGPYRTDAAARLIRDLGVDDLVVQLGPVPYRSLVNLYRQCDLYVSPAYAESFAHPLVEAMATGVPVVASDIAVHREICGDAALYFDRFSPRQLAKSVTELVASPELIARNRQSGWERARQFSWKRHVDMLVFHAQSLLKTSYERAPGGLSERVPQDFRHVADANCGTSR